MRQLTRRVLAALRTLREEKGLPQDEVAWRLGKKQSWLARIEQGRRRLRFDTFLQLCDFYGVAPEEVIRRARGSEENRPAQD